MKTSLALAVAALLALAPAAHAGGWATVGLSSTPTSTSWVVDLTILQHGRTPLEGVKPVVIVEGGGRFTATPTGKPGVYRAAVRFPSPGRWEYRIDDGFTRVHAYPAVELGAPAAAASSGPDLRLLVPGVALLLAAAALVMPRRRPQPQAA